MFLYNLYSSIKNHLKQNPSNTNQAITNKSKPANELLNRLIIDPLPTHIYGPEAEKLPAEAHITFEHMPSTIFRIPKEGGTINFNGVEEILNNAMNGITVLVVIIKSYCGDDLVKPLDISKHPYFHTNLIFFQRRYVNEDSLPYGVSNQKPIINSKGEAHMKFNAMFPALCFHLNNV